MVIPLSTPSTYYVVPRISSMSGNMVNSHRISEYLKCSPKAFSTWVYVATMLNPSPLPLSLLPSFSIYCWPHSPRFPVPCSAPLWCTLSSVIYANSRPHQCLLPTGSTPLLPHTTLSIPIESPHISPESSASLLPLSGKPNPPIVRLVPLTLLTISPPTSSLQFRLRDFH